MLISISALLWFSHCFTLFDFVLEIVFVRNNGRPRRVLTVEMMKRLIKSFLGQLGLKIRLLRNSAKPLVAEAPDASGNIITTTVSDQEIFFFVTDEFDVIQQEHVHGRFYETEELQIIAEHFKGGVFTELAARDQGCAIEELSR